MANDTQKNTDKSSPLPVEVMKWIRSQGFPVEISVGNELRKRGFTVRHSRTFRDPVKGKLRETDLVATLDSRVVDWSGDAHVRASLHFVIECRSARKNPWVVFAVAGQNAGESDNTGCVDPFSRICVQVAQEQGIQKPS